MRPTPIRNAYVPEPPASPVVSVSRKHHFAGGTPRICPFEMGSKQVVRQILQIGNADAAVPPVPLVQFFGFEVAAVGSLDFGKRKAGGRRKLAQDGWFPRRRSKLFIDPGDSAPKICELFLKVAHAECDSTT